LGEIVQGIAASPGVVIGPAFVLRSPKLDVPHATVPRERIEWEIKRFHAARQEAIRQTSELRRQVEERLGVVQAKIFDPQLLMLDDPDLIQGAVTYISESFLTAERAFSLRVLEFRSQWLDATHARVMDRVADLNDVQARVLAHLIDLGLSDLFGADRTGPVILVAHELTPSHVVKLDPDHVVGVATDAGTRTAHASILARALGVPAVVGLGNLSRRVETGVELILDGKRGTVVIAPSEAERHRFHDREVKAQQTARDLEHLKDLASETRDGQSIGLYANLELPSEAREAVALNVNGVGLFRTEFLVVGKAAAPDEQEQYEAFRSVVEVMAPRPVTIRAFDLGGDKFPLFVPPIAEENPFLGWRGMRIYKLIPELFNSQVRAILRAAAHGPVRFLVPMINTVDEVRGVRAAIAQAAAELTQEGLDHGSVMLGVMLETPASVAIADVLGRHVDFFSVGTNDLIQYMLAVDRGNAQLSSFFDLYHPAIARCIRSAVLAAEQSGRPICVCGEAASDPLGATLLIALGVRSLSCSPSAILEQKKLIRSLDLSELQPVADHLLAAETGQEVRKHLLEALVDVGDLPGLDVNSALSHTE
jgi:phosphotransferase system enzyme I (PtsI)